MPQSRTSLSIVAFAVAAFALQHSVCCAEEVSQDDKQLIKTTSADVEPNLSALPAPLQDLWRRITVRAKWVTGKELFDSTIFSSLINGIAIDEDFAGRNHPQDLYLITLCVSSRPLPKRILSVKATVKVRQNEIPFKIVSSGLSSTASEATVIKVISHDEGLPEDAIKRLIANPPQVSIISVIAK